MTSRVVIVDIEALKSRVAALEAELERRRPGRPPKDKAE